MSLIVEKTESAPDEKSGSLSRQGFLKSFCLLMSGLTLSQVSCTPTNFSGGNGSTALGLSFGSQDIGLLNYLYVVEQIQYNFYLKLINSGVFDKNSDAFNLLTDILYHQLTHSQFYLNVLGTNAITGINLDFSSIDFTQKSSVLSFAENFQNTESQAYLGVAKYFNSSSFLTLCRQIGVVESRHSAFISHLAGGSSIIDTKLYDPNGFELGLSPVSVLNFYKPYIKTALDSSTLPSS